MREHKKSEEHKKQIKLGILKYKNNYFVWKSGRNEK